MIILTEEDKKRLVEEAEANGDYFDEEEVINNCTVQILRNTRTGEVSVGWWRNGISEMLM